MNSVATFIAADGIPAAVFAAKMHRAATGCHGGAQFTKALASVGPGGMIEGMITLGVLQAVSYFLTDFVTEQVLVASVRKMVRRRVPVDQITESIDRYPVSFGLKEKLKKRATAFTEKEQSYSGGSRTNIIQSERSEADGKEV